MSSAASFLSRAVIRSSAISFRAFSFSSSSISTSRRAAWRCEDPDGTCKVDGPATGSAFSFLRGFPTYEYARPTPIRIKSESKQMMTHCDDRSAPASSPPTPPKGLRCRPNRWSPCEATCSREPSSRTSCDPLRKSRKPCRGPIADAHRSDS